MARLVESDGSLGQRRCGRLGPEGLDLVYDEAGGIVCGVYAFVVGGEGGERIGRR